MVLLADCYAILLFVMENENLYCFFIGYLNVKWPKYLLSVCSAKRQFVRFLIQNITPHQQCHLELVEKAPPFVTQTYI